MDGTTTDLTEILSAIRAGGDKIDLIGALCDVSRRCVGSAEEWVLLTEISKCRGWGWIGRGPLRLRVPRPVRVKAPPARRGRMHGPKYSAKHDPMFTPEALTVEMVETIRIELPRLRTMDSPDVILRTGARLGWWLDWQSPKMQACAQAAFKAAGLVTRDGWFYQPPKPAPLPPRTAVVRVGGAA